MSPTRKEHGKRGAARHARRLLKSARCAAKQLTHQDDDEALHRFRVRVRQLRTFLRTYRKHLGPKRVDKPIARLGKLIDITNTSRDLQVQLLWLDKVWSSEHLEPRARESARWMTKHLASHGPGANGVEPKWLAKRLKKTARRLNTELKALVDGGNDKDAGKQNKAFNRVAGRQILKTADRLEQLLGSIQGLDDKDTAHRARLTAKRLRYIVEQMRRHADDAQPAVDELKHLQDMLGELRDRQVLEAEIGKCLDAGTHDEAMDSEVLNAGLNDLIQQLRHEQDDLHQQLDRTWLQDHGRAHLEPTRRVGQTLQSAS